MTSISDREITIQITWKAPSWISQGSGFDKLRVTFLQADAFVNRMATSIQDETKQTKLEYFLQA